jgi:hypothetical protein
MGILFLFREQYGQCVMLTTHIHLALKLRMSGDITLLPLYAFGAWTRKTLPSTDGMETCVELGHGV